MMNYLSTGSVCLSINSSACKTSMFCSWHEVFAAIFWTWTMKFLRSLIKNTSSLKLTASLLLKMDSWKMTAFLLGFGLFSGALLAVSFREDVSPDARSHFHWKGLAAMSLRLSLKKGCRTLLAISQKETTLKSRIRSRNFPVAVWRSKS